MSHKDHKPTASRTAEEKRAVINRLKRIEGQVRGIQRMIDSDRYCVDVLVQMSAIDAALKKVRYGLLEHHTKHCVSNAIQLGEGDAAIDELMDVFKQFAK